jgi:hypothetical protein
MSTNPLNYYPPGRIPAEAYMMTPDPKLEDLIDHIQLSQEKRGRKQSRQQILDHIDRKSAEMGITPAEGRGFFSDVWHGVKKIAKNVGSNVWDKVKDDPIGSLNAFGQFIAPIVESAGPAVI